MKRFLVLLFLAMQISAATAFAVSSSSLFIKELTNLPDGIIASRPDVSPTNYNTEYSEALSPQQKQIESIYAKVYGLDQIDSKDFQAKAEAIYLLEHEISLFLRSVPTTKLPAFEKNSLIYRGIQAYKSLRTSAEQTYDNTLRLIDIALPGPGGPQIRVGTKNGSALYAPNYRSDTPLNDEQKTAFYESKLSGFIAEGGSLDELKVLTSAGVMADSKDLSAYEYIQSADGEIRFTAGSAGHLILAKGELVRAAGNIAVVRDINGKILMLVVSNSSGTFKPDIYSAEQTARKIARTLKVSDHRVVVTRGEPFGLQNLKILLKASLLPKSEIENRLKNLKIKVATANGTLASGRCEKIFRK